MEFGGVLQTNPPAWRVVELAKQFARRGPEVRVHIATPATLDARIKTGSGDISSRMPLGTGA